MNTNANLLKNVVLFKIELFDVSWKKAVKKKITESNTLCNQFQDISIHILDEIPQKKCFILTHTKIINNRSVIHRII